MSYHNTSTSTSTSTASSTRSTTNALGQTAPAGYHYMPDGSLMADSAHVGYKKVKVIKSFNLDTSNIKEAGERRAFTVLGDNGAVFSLEVKSGSNYYNFTTNLFQATQTRLTNASIGGGSYNGNISFPNAVVKDKVNGTVSTGGGNVKVVMDTAVASTMAVGDRVTGNAALGAANVTVAALDPDDDNVNEFSLSQAIAIADDVVLSFTGAHQYDVYLFSETNFGTSHAGYAEARFSDGTIDVNSSKGSNSNLVQKVIYQTLDVVITISGDSPNGLVTGVNTNSSITTSRGGSVAKIPFSYTLASLATKALTQIKQPTSSDVMAYIQPLIGATPINIPGENIYPAVTAVDKVVNVSGGTAVDDDPPNVTMDDDFTGLWAVGDRITGNAALDARTQKTAVTVAAINVNVGSGVNPKIFTMSEGIVIADDEELSFSNRRNYRWPISSTTYDVSKIKPGMRQKKGSVFANPPIVREYLTQTTALPSGAGEYKVDKVRVPAIETFGVKPIITRDAITKVAKTTVGTATNPISITFSEQALLSFGGENGKIYGYGESEINRLTGYNVEFSDLAIALTEFTTTTTAATTAATTFNVTSAAGIADDISTVSGIGIDSSTANPTITTITNLAGGTYASSDATYPAAILTVGAAQTLESGATLKFPGASNIATITGNIKVNNVGNEDIVLRFDLEKLLTMH